MFTRNIAVVQLQNDKANAINTALLWDFNQALDRAQEARGLIITGSGHFFSAGLDLKEVFPLSREEMRDFMKAFIRTVRRVLQWPGPTVAAINGHALGGGFLLALACDARLAHKNDRIRIGFPSVETHVPLSHSLQWIALHALPLTERGLVTGQAENMSPREAFRRGLVHSLVSPDSEALLAAAREWILTRPDDFSVQKRHHQHLLRARLDTLGEEDVDHFLEQWFAPPTRSAFQQVWQNLV